MLDVQAWRAVSLATVAVAGASLIWWVASQLLGVGMAVFQFARRNSLGRQLEAMFRNDDEARGTTATTNRAYALWVGLMGGAVLAMVARDPLVSPVMLLAGGGLGYMRRIRVRKRESRSTAQEVHTLVESFRSVFPVTHSVFSALEQSIRLLPGDSAVAQATNLTLQRQRLGRNPDEFWQPLEQIDNPHLNEFLFLLQRAGQAEMDQIDKALRDLLERTNRQRQRARRARVVMARLSSTVRVGQGALLAMAIVTFVVSLWRDYWLSTLDNRLLFATLVAGGVFMSLYFEERQRALQEEFA